MKALTSLHLASYQTTAICSFGALPAAMGQALPNLQHLQLSSCGITAVPAALAQLPWLASVLLWDKRAPAGDPPPVVSLPAAPCTAALRELRLSSGELPASAWALSALAALGCEQFAGGAADLQPASRLQSLRELQLTHYAGDDLAAALHAVMLPPAVTNLALVGCGLERLPALASEACWQRLKAVGCIVQQVLPRSSSECHFADATGFSAVLTM